jgi:hypothetical protein
MVGGVKVITVQDWPGGDPRRARPLGWIVADLVPGSVGAGDLLISSTVVGASGQWRMPARSRDEQPRLMLAAAAGPGALPQASELRVSDWVALRGLRRHFIDGRRGTMPTPVRPPNARRLPRSRAPQRRTYRDRIHDLPMLHRSQVEAMIRRGDRADLTVRVLRRQGILLALRLDRDYEFPAFQFADGTWLPQAAYLNQLLSAGRRPATAFRWWTSPQPGLHGMAPMDALNDPESAQTLVDLATYHA